MADAEELSDSVTYLSEFIVKSLEAALNGAEDVQRLESLKNCKIQISDLHEAVENDTFSKALSEIQDQLNENLEQILFQTENPPTKKPRHDVELKLKAQDGAKILETVKETHVVPKINGFNEIAGLENIKSTLERLLILPTKQPQLYTNLNVGNCILFYGPPGTGKTKIVHALASEANVSLHCVTASTILSPFVGQTEKTLRELFQYMRSPGGRSYSSMKSMVYADGELKASSNTPGDFGGNQNAFLICATNCPWDLDVAFMRRFQEKLYFPLPNYEQRLDLLKLYTQNTFLKQTWQTWEPLLRSTEGFSGSDLNDLVQHALRMPIIRLQGTKVWQKLEDKYKPVKSGPGFKFDLSTEYIFCNLRDLPANSVLMDEGHVLDLYEALKKVRRTVSETEMKRYNDFM